MRGLQERVKDGFSRAARRLGAPSQHYRVLDPCRPLENRIGSPFLCLDAESGFRLRRPRVWGQPVVYSLTDADDLRIGDIFAQDNQYYFVSDMEPYRPPLCIACNSVISVSALRGKEGYLVRDCPVSLLLEGRSEMVQSGMPGALRPGYFRLLMPVLPQFCLMPYMTVRDGVNAVFTVIAAELSGNGIRARVAMQQL